MRSIGYLGTRWLGVGLASALAVVTLGLALTGRLDLYINPSSNWFAIPMSILLLVGSALSFLLPLGAEADHGHDHGDPGEPDAHDHDSDDAAHAPEHTHPPDHDHVARGRGGRLTAGTLASVAGGIVASGVVAAIVLLPPASLSAEIAMSRDTGAAPLFAGADVVSLATSGDTRNFGVGDWASVFATSTNPDAFEGDTVTLTGFATPDDAAGAFKLTRLVITHCVIDAQAAGVPVAMSGTPPATGQWVTVTGKVRTTSAGKLEIAATGVADVSEPKDPYEY